MWYRIDLKRLAVQLVPPVLRSGFFVAMLKVLVTPLVHICNRMIGLYESVSDKLNITANVICLEKLLNDSFFLAEHRIYIESLEEDVSSCWHFKKEKAPARFLHMKNGGIILKFKGESSYKKSFTIYVPTFLCTSLDSGKDKFEGKNIAKIKELMAIYKPAGRTFSITLYDYE